MQRKMSFLLQRRFLLFPKSSSIIFGNPEYLCILFGYQRQEKPSIEPVTGSVGFFFSIGKFKICPIDFARSIINSHLQKIKVRRSFAFFNFISFVLE